MPVTEYTLRIFNETNTRIPRKKIEAIYTDILKKKENLTVVFVGDTFSREINNRYRGKDAPANVLSFPSSTDIDGISHGPSSAEIYINADMAMRDQEEPEVSFSDRVLFLCIHGMLHIAGYQHGREMEAAENMYATKYI